MKTAVLISGQLRTFKKCYPTQKWQIFRHYEPDIHFFCSICHDEQAPDISLLQRDYPSVSVEVVDDPTDLPKIPIEAGRFSPYANATTHDKLMLQHWGNKRVWDFFCSKTDPSSFGAIIRIRPDLWIHRFELPEYDGTFDLSPEYTAFPWWGKFGGINDRLAVLGWKAARVYFNVYDAIPKLLEVGCPFHPETLMAENLRREGMRSHHPLMTEFSTLRMDGSQRWAEIVMSDVAELISTR